MDFVQVTNNQIELSDDCDPKVCGDKKSKISWIKID